MTTTPHHLTTSRPHHLRPEPMVSPALLLSHGFAYACTTSTPCHEFLLCVSFRIFCQASAVKREYFVLLQDLVGKSHRWPRAIQHMVFRQTHLNNQERFSVIVFLYRNGVDPCIIRDFFSECYQFDCAAWRQINWVVRELEHGRGWKQWNVFLGRSV